MTADARGMGKVALVTGAGSGIGRAAALRLHEAGFSVALAGRRRDVLEAVAEAAAELGGEARGQILIVPTDVTDPDAVQRLFRAVEEHFGRLDVLFNNAGAMTPATPLEELPVETWRSVLDVNVTGYFLCMQQAFRLMKKQAPQGGRIINNGSLSASVPRPHSIAYTASKHAVTGLTKSASLDGRRYNIACGQIDIGNVATALTSGFSGGMAQADGSLKPEPLFDVEHVAEAVLYMAQLPLDVNVQFITVMATQMPYIGRG